MDPAIQLSCRLGLALLFVLATAHKLRDFAAFRSQLAAYRIVPDGLVLPLAALLPGIETAIAVALLTSATAATAALAAAVLLTVYSSAIAVNLVRGRTDIDCGCGAAGTKLSTALVARNAVATLVALGAAAPVAARDLLWPDALTVLGGVASGILLFHAAGIAGANRLASAGWSR
jgi:hypothetical protein